MGGVNVRLGYVVALWRRPKLALAMLRHLRRIDPEGVISVVVSPEDPEPVRRADLRAVGGLVIGEQPNDPRGDKWQWGLAGHRTGWWDAGPDAVMILGSDDFPTAGYLDAVRAQVAAGVAAGGLLDCIVWRPADGKLGRWAGYAGPRAGETIGSGRWYSRAALDALKWRLWPADGRRTGLDRAAHDRCEAAGLSLVPMACSPGVALVDVKSDPDVDIGGWESMAGEMREHDEPGIFDLPADTMAEIEEATDPVPAAPLFPACESPNLSAVMIVRDEAWFIPRCLRSLAGRVDEVTVLVDSRTADRTREIARAAGCVVHESPWLGFGPSRTLSLQLARGPWALVIDADEVLVSGDPREGLGDDVDGASVTFVTDGDHGTQARQAIRIVRREKARYTHARHNVLEGIATVARSAVTMRTSYRGTSRQKAREDIEALRAEWAESGETSQHAAYYLARAHRTLAEFEEARRWAIEARSIAPGTLLGAGAILEAMHCAAALGDLRNADEWYALGLAEHPDLPDLHHAHLAVTIARWSSAVLARRYESLPQTSTIELAMRIPDVVRALRLPLSV